MFPRSAWEHFGQMKTIPTQSVGTRKALMLVANNKEGNGKKLIHRPKEWQKYLHAMYFGKLYFWQEEALVCPIHMEPYECYVEHGNWVDDFYDDIGESLEGTYWHDEHYDGADYGGYHRTSKTIKEVRYPKREKQVLHLVEDFVSSKRKPFNPTNWSIPESLLWIDTLKKWW